MWGWVGLYGRPLWLPLRHWFINARATSPHPRPYEFCHIHYTLLWSELQYSRDTSKITDANASVESLLDRSRGVILSEEVSP